MDFSTKKEYDESKVINKGMELVEKKHRYVYLLLVVSALLIIFGVTFTYIRQLNRTILENIIH